MTATYNLHDIMTTAWSLYRKFSHIVSYTFSSALKEAWRRAKEAIIDRNATYSLSYGGNTILLNLKTGDITGDTYQMRTIIKTELSAKWVPDMRVWHSDDLANVVKALKSSLTSAYGLKIQNTHETRKTSGARAAFNHVVRDMKPCPRCGSWCYGECSLYARRR